MPRRISLSLLRGERLRTAGMRYAAWLVILLFGFTRPLSAEQPAAVSILSTDFSRCHDADDWFDVVMFCTDPALHPAGIVLDWHFSTVTWEEEERAISPLLASLRADTRPVVRGVRGKLRREPDGSVRSPDSDAGARLILDTMRAAPGKVRLISVGSLKNEALAYAIDPELFATKLDRFYVLGGTLSGVGECNLDYDRLAFEIVFNSTLPKVWVPGERALVQRFDANHEAAMRQLDHPAAQLLSRQLDDFRKARTDIARRDPSDIVYRHNFHGKSLWSNPLFLHAGGRGDAFGMRWSRGRCSNDPQRLTQFTDDPTGQDEMFVTANNAAIGDWVFQRLKHLPLPK